MNINVIFRNIYEDLWSNDDLVKRMILDVDKSIVKSPSCIESPVLGQIPPEYLSGGVKSLIVLLKTSRIASGDSMGSNCAKWLVEIGKRKDIEIDLNYFMNIDPNGNEVYIVNDGSAVSTKIGFLEKELEYHK